ncbi:hypothetical protein JXJ21_02130 [candidate division KSB1 bacterium]|nr:hypothetical protein [candidate division KSB1 bacterium]
MFSQDPPPDESLEKLKELADFYNWPGKSGAIRAGANLAKYTIPELEGAPITHHYSNPSFWRVDNKINIKRAHTYIFTDTDLIHIHLTVSETCEGAHEYYIRRLYVSSLPFEVKVPPGDSTKIIGDISFYGARHFIRNNIAVEFTPEGELINKLVTIASQLDSILLMCPTAVSADPFKPVIEKFDIARNTVKPQSYAKLFIEARDPLGEGLTYKWEMTNGGIDVRDTGEYFYYSSYDEKQDTLTLHVINEAGFLSSAELIITVSNSTGF